MKKIYIILVLFLSIIALTQCKTTNKNKARGSANELAGTWTVEVEEWKNPGENSLTLARKAEASKDVSLDNAPAAQPAKEPTEEEKAKAAKEKEKKEEEAKASTKKEEASKIKISLEIKADTKKKEISGTLTRTQESTAPHDSFSGKLKSNTEFEGIDYKSGDKTGKISGKLQSKDSLSITVKF